MQTSKIYKPFVSVIVPTHNRAASVQSLLQSLCLQIYPAELFEVIVVADGCNDNTADILHKRQFPFAFTCLELEGAGAATARNRGAEDAKGDLLIFVDDDVIASKELIEAHVESHTSQKDVIVGYLPMSRLKNESIFRISVRSWWEEKFYQMSLPGYRHSFEDLLSGNFSIAADFFKSTGKFDNSFKCAEDYELGIRLIKAGAQFKFCQQAMGWHNDTVTDLKRSLQRKRAEGFAHVSMSRLHPHVLNRFRLSKLVHPNRRHKWLQWLIFRSPATADSIMRIAEKFAAFYERSKFRQHFSRLSSKLHDYWYLRGASEHFNSYQEMLDHVEKTRTSIPAPEYIIQLAEGISAAAAMIATDRPDAATVKFGSHVIGNIPYEYGEPLTADHLKRLLLTSMKAQYMRTVAFDISFLKYLQPEHQKSKRVEEPAYA